MSPLLYNVLFLSIYSFAANAQAFPTSSADIAQVTGALSDTTQIDPPPIPQSFPTSFDVQVPASAPDSASPPQRGDFFGFSIELSVSDQFFGKKANSIPSPLVRLLQNLRDRAGGVRIRLGGNSQERSETVDGDVGGGLTIVKDSDDTSDNPTSTPRVVFGTDLINDLANLSSSANVEWWLGIPFNDTTPRLQIVEIGERILGKNVIGFQLGNEPDLYPKDNRSRPGNWNQNDYVNEFKIFTDAIQNNGNIKNKNMLVGPSVCCGGSGGGWTPEQVFDAGFLKDFGDMLNGISVEHYPTNNCGAKGRDLTGLLDSTYLNHSAIVANNAPYTNTAKIAQQMNKPFIMMETNTASCAGFPGLSNSFAAALWGIDHVLNMASIGFTNALFHAAGQNAYYNPFTPPQGSLAKKRGWAVGPTYYSALAVAEALGPSGKSRVQDLSGEFNGGNVKTPGYVIYDGDSGKPTRVALMNYVSDKSGGSDYVAQLKVGNGVKEVKVRYLISGDETTSDIFNFQWAGQTLGNLFDSDGTMLGTVNTTTITCSNAGSCPIPVKAPSFALVFLSDEALAEVSPANSNSTSGGQSSTGGSGGKSGGSGDSSNGSAAVSFGLGWMMTVVGMIWTLKTMI